MKFRKKPLIIDAVQWHKFGDSPHVKKPIGTILDDDGNHCGIVETLEGNMTVIPGDWIITGIKGEHYPCKSKIFEATYEQV